MKTSLLNTIGIAAGTLTTASFVPQAVKIWQAKAAKDVSLVMFFILATGVALWVVYGIIAGALPIILTNSFTLVLAVAIIVLKIKYK
jgi:MtN3 and saliva related transmembrane protein